MPCKAGEKGNEMRKTGEKRGLCAAGTAVLLLCGVLLCACGGEEPSGVSAEETTEFSREVSGEIPAERSEESGAASEEISADTSEESVTEESGAEQSGEESEVPGGDAEKFTGEGGTLELYSDGSFLLEQTMPLNVKSKDGKDCALVYGYYGFYEEQDGKATLWLKDGYFRGTGMENDEELAGEIAETLAGENADRAVVAKWKTMLSGGQLALSDVMSKAEIEAMRKTGTDAVLDRDGHTYRLGE